MVPPFINPDDIIVLNTRTLEYVKKLKKWNFRQQI
jgi:hypothetical protein